MNGLKVTEVSETHSNEEEKTIVQRLVDKRTRVFKTVEWYSTDSDKESLGNLKPENVGHSNINISNVIGVSSDCLGKNLVSEIKHDQIKREKPISNIEIKKDLTKNKEKIVIEKDNIDNPFLRIIGEMTNNKSDKQKQKIKKLSLRRKQNVKNLSSEQTFLKYKLSNETENKSKSNSKLKSQEFKSILEKTNYSICVENKEFISEIKPKESENLSPLPKTGKRSISPSPSDSTTEKKFKSGISNNKKIIPIEGSSKDDDGDKQKCLKSALVFVRSKSSNKSVSWKEDSDLVQVSYFEYDENERVNVARKSKSIEMHEYYGERQNCFAFRELNFADNMRPENDWRYLDNSLLIDVPEERGDKTIEPGSGSLEQSDFRVTYFTKDMYACTIPESPEEPDQTETVPYRKPLNIPFENTTGNMSTVYNYADVPWPEPKGEQPPLLESSVGTHNTMMRQRFSAYDGNQMNYRATPHNNTTAMVSPTTNYNMLVRPNQMPMNGRQTFISGRMPQQHPRFLPAQQHPRFLPAQQPPRFLQEQQHPRFLPAQQPPRFLQEQQPPRFIQAQQHPRFLPAQQLPRFLPAQQPPTQQRRQQMYPGHQVQRTRPPGPPTQRDRRCSQQQPPANNGPPYFNLRDGRGQTTYQWDDDSNGGNYGSYIGKMNRINQRGDRGVPFSRTGGHPENERFDRLDNTWRSY